MENKFRIKVGPIEIEHEGIKDLKKDEIIEFITDLIKLLKINEIALGNEHVIERKNDPINKPGEIQGTTNSLAAKLGGASGTDLILVAAACQTFVKKQKTFSRQNLLDEIKTATGYYKKSYSSNFSNYLQTLVRNGKLLEISRDSYSLDEKIKKEIEAKLVN